MLAWQGWQAGQGDQPFLFFFPLLLFMICHHFFPSLSEGRGEKSGRRKERREAYGRCLNNRLSANGSSYHSESRLITPLVPLWVSDTWWKEPHATCAQPRTGNHPIIIPLGSTCSCYFSYCYSCYFYLARAARRSRTKTCPAIQLATLWSTFIHAGVLVCIQDKKAITITIIFTQPVCRVCQGAYELTANWCTEILKKYIRISNGWQKLRKATDTEKNSASTFLKSCPSVDYSFLYLRFPYFGAKIQEIRGEWYGTWNTWRKHKQP